MTDTNVILVLHDSRARTSTGKRTIYKFPSTPGGMYDAWMVVVHDEVTPDEIDGYMFMAECEEHEIDESCDSFNCYWAVYGWYLGRYDDDFLVPDDCVEG